MSFIWTDELVQTVRELAAEGKSTHLIGSIVGTTRCSVIGKCRREKIPLSKYPADRKMSRPRPRYRRAMVQVPQPPVQNVSRETPPHLIPKPPQQDTGEFLAIEFNDLADYHCRYPEGAGIPDIRFCGQPHLTGSAYCAKHHAVCFSTYTRPDYRGA